MPMPASHPELALEVLRRQQLGRLHGLAQTGCVVIECVDEQPREWCPRCLPTTGRELVRYVLHHCREYMVSRGRQTRIRDAGEGDFKDGGRGELTILRMIECALDVFQRGRQQQSPTQRRFL